MYISNLNKNRRKQIAKTPIKSPFGGDAET